MCASLSEKIKAINSEQTLPPIKSKEEKKSSVKMDDLVFEDECYAEPNDNSWWKWLLIILGIDGILLAVALGRFIFVGI